MTMKNAFQYSLLVVFFAFVSSAGFSQKKDDLKIVVIRHAEKPGDNNNLTCQGLNRSLALPNVLIKKFGVPNYTYVPALGLGDQTKHARMFQTITPLAVKYKLDINSSYDEKDYKGLAKDLVKKRGVVLVVWEHSAIIPIMHTFGIDTNSLSWPDDDFDSIWIITFKNGSAVLTKDHESIKPAQGCPF